MVPQPEFEQHDPLQLNFIAGQPGRQAFQAREKAGTVDKPAFYYLQFAHLQKVTG